MITMIKMYLGLFLGLFVVSLTVAQTSINPNSELPLNPNVKHGVLENGITYYVMHNEEPKDRASFYIVQNVGAILENDDQNGLAHFLEHMAFNGTKNFPDKGILNYLEGYGVAFGRNINAYTDVDETVYNLSDVPTKNPKLIDSTLLILHDWCDYLLLTDKEIDSERGVIREEWRTRRSGSMRVYLEQQKLLFQGSKYAERDIIGSLDVINNFEYQTIRDFYHDWYRTDLQAIIVVGDINADSVESRIKTMFAEIKPVENPKTRQYYEVPPNKEPIVGVVTDPEESSIRFMAYYKHPAVSFSDKNLGYYRNYIMSMLYSTMLDMRFDELLQKGNPPFVYAFNGYYNIARLADAYITGANLKEDNILGGIETVMVENERVLRYGFAQSELDRAKTELLSNYEKAFKERNKIKNDKLVAELTQNYLSNEPTPGIDMEYQLVQQLLPGISIEEINILPKEWITDTNQVFVITGTEKEGLTYPSNDQIKEVIAGVKSMDIAPYEDKTINEPLIAMIPKAGKIKKTESLNDFGATQFTLSNGAKVIIKPTDFKENQIILSAYSKGGSSLCSVTDLPSVSMLGNFIPSFGIGNFDQISLQKILTGKIVNVSFSVGDLYEQVSGSSSVADFETMLQLLYLGFEQPRFDKEAFDALKARYMAYVANMNADINKAFRDTVSLITTDYNKRTTLFNAKMVEDVNFETIKKVYLDRFTDPSDFTFILVGNINVETAKPLIETYIGGIKTNKRSETFKDNGVKYPDQNVNKNFARDMQTPKTTIYINWHGYNMEYNAKNRMLLSYMVELLDKKYIDIIREEEGGSYGVWVDGAVSNLPSPEYYLMAKFDTDPAKAGKLKAIVYNELKNIENGQIDTIDMEEARKNFLKVREENLRKNEFWVGALNQYFKNNESIVVPGQYEALVNSITPDEIKNFAATYFNDPGIVEVIMTPANQE